MLEGKRHLYVLFGVTVLLLGLDNQILRWSSQKINWFKLSCLRYGIRGVFAVLGSVLLATSIGHRFKDPSLSAESVHKWSYGAVVAIAAASAVAVTFAGYAAMYLVTHTKTPTTMAASLSAGIILAALCTGWLFFGENLSKLQLCGIGAAIASVVLMNFEQTKLPVHPPSEASRAL